MSVSLAPSEPPETAVVRPAHRDDITPLAALLVQLYDAELPGVLVGSPASWQALLRFTLVHFASGAQQGFSSLAPLVAFLEREVGQAAATHPLP